MSYTRVAPGIYKDSRTGNLYERPTIDGRKTWRKLSSPTVKGAKRELAAKRTDQARATQGLAKDPYAPATKTIGQLCAEYIKAGCPDRQHQSRADSSQERYRLETLLPFWSKKTPASIRAKDCALYFAWRKRQIARGSGGRTVDLELGSLSNVLHWAVLTGKADVNPLAAGRPRFRNTKTVKHCREFMPIDGNELHKLAGYFFSSFRSEVIGWQLLLEAMTGCRTSEVLRLRWDARHQGEAGFIENEWLWIARSKGGVKPFVQIHPALAECIAALKRWHAWRHPRSNWWLPSWRVKNQPVESGSLTHALARVSPKLCGAHRTSHGLRAFYVTVRRSQGVSDAQIADEIGDKSGAALIVSTYGSVPPNWRGSAALSWLPATGNPAWSALKIPDNIVVCRGVFQASGKS